MYVCIYLPGVVAPSENESSRTLYCIYMLDPHEDHFQSHEV